MRPNRMNLKDIHGYLVGRQARFKSTRTSRIYSVPLLHAVNRLRFLAALRISRFLTEILRQALKS